MVIKISMNILQKNVKSKNNDGWTPLHYASRYGYLDIVEYLTKECKCDVESKDNDGETPLHIASKYGIRDIVQYLTEECHAKITDRIIKAADNSEIKDYLRSKK